MTSNLFASDILNSLSNSSTNNNVVTLPTQPNSVPMAGSNNNKLLRKHKYYWTKENCQEEAKKYTTRYQFAIGNGSAYHAARLNNWLDEICTHMTSSTKPKGYWNKERCQEEAMKYTSRSKYMIGSGSSYRAALLHNWLDEICAHMSSGNNQPTPVIPAPAISAPSPKPVVAAEPTKVKVESEVEDQQFAKYRRVSYPSYYNSNTAIPFPVTYPYSAPSAAVPISNSFDEEDYHTSTATFLDKEHVPDDDLIFHANRLLDISKSILSKYNQTAQLNSLSSSSTIPSVDTSSNSCSSLEDIQLAAANNQQKKRKLMEHMEEFHPISNEAKKLMMMASAKQAWEALNVKSKEAYSNQMKLQQQMMEEYANSAYMNANYGAMPFNLPKDQQHPMMYDPRMAMYPSHPYQSYYPSYKPYGNEYLSYTDASSAAVAAAWKQLNDF